MKKLIFGGIVATLTLLFVYTQNSSDDKVQTQHVSKTEVDRVDSGNNIIYPAQTTNIKSRGKLSTSVPYQTSSTKESLSALPKITATQASYQTLQQKERNYHLALKHSKQIYMQKEKQRKMMVQRYQQMQRSMAMRSIKKAKIKAQRVAQMNLRYRDLYQQQRLRSTSKLKNSQLN